MSGPASFDVLIVGNGVIGSSIALATLRREPNLRVGLVGEPTRPYSASTAAGAMLGCFGEVTGALLSTSHGRAKLAMAIEASKHWPEWLEEIRSSGASAPKVTIDRGTFVIENAKSGLIEGENFDAIRLATREHGAACEDVSPTSVPGLAPEIDARPLRALYLANEGSIDASALLAALDARLDQFERFGRITESASALVTEGGRIRGVKMADARVVEAKHVVIAAGAKSQDVIDTLPDLARRVPRLFAGVGESLLLKTRLPAFPNVIRTPNRAFACGLHLVPRGDGCVYIGATNIVNRDPVASGITMTNLYFLMECALEQIHHGLYAASVQKIQTGNRPVSADTCPLIGETSVEGLWILSGTYRDGLHMSPFLAKDLVDRIFGGKGLFDNPFRPERKLISLRTKEAVLEDIVRHMLASGAEHGIKLPKVGWQDTLVEVTRMRATQIYGSIEGETVMPVDLFSMIDADPERMIPYMNEYYRTTEAAWA